MTMRFFEAASDISATPASVWATLTDAESWSQWAGVRSVDGRIAPGETITIHTDASGGRAFPVRVTTFEAPSTLVFSGGMPLGLFRGVRTYRLTPIGDGGGTHLSVREEYSGPLLPLMWRSMPDLQPSFDRFVAGLKARAEHGLAG